MPSNLHRIESETKLSSDGETKNVSTSSNNSTASSGETEREKKPSSDDEEDSFRRTYARRVVNSSYRDFSGVPAEALESGPSALIARIAAPKDPTFPVKLHMILSTPEYEPIISWLPHGRAWRIIQQDKFEKEIIPLYYHHRRFTSFARQISGWGFIRITSGPDFNSYYHELFLRGKPELCTKMKRLTSKDLSARKREPADPPDFYKLDREYPLPRNYVVNPKKAPLGINSRLSGSQENTIPSTITTSNALSNVHSNQGNSNNRAMDGNIALAQLELTILQQLHAQIQQRISELTKIQQNNGNGVTDSGSGLDLQMIMNLLNGQNVISSLSSPPTGNTNAPASTNQVANQSQSLVGRQEQSNSQFASQPAASAAPQSNDSAALQGALDALLKSLSPPQQAHQDQTQSNQHSAQNSVPNVSVSMNDNSALQEALQALLGSATHAAPAPQAASNPATSSVSALTSNNIESLLNSLKNSGGGSSSAQQQPSSSHGMPHQQPSQSLTAASAAPDRSYSSSTSSYGAARLSSPSTSQSSTNGSNGHQYQSTSSLTSSAAGNDIETLLSRILGGQQQGLGGVDLSSLLGQLQQQPQQQSGNQHRPN